MLVLTKIEALERLIVSDFRLANNIGINTSTEMIVTILADCGARFIAARDLGDKELLRSAEHNLRLMSNVYSTRVPFIV